MLLTDKEKKSIVLGILNVFAKTGALLVQINKEFEKETGEKLAPDKNIAIEYMKTLEEVYVDQTGRYFSCSEKSKHIAKMVAEQNTKVSPNYRGRGPINKTFNNAFPTRALVSYDNDYVDVQRPSTSGFQAGKIQRRRQTMGAALTTSNDKSLDAEKRTRRISMDRDRAPKRPRSHSRSPARRSPPRYNHSVSHSPQRQRRERRSISPKYSPPQYRRRSRSPRERRGRRSPSRNRRSISPRNKRSASPRNKRSVSPREKRPRHQSRQISPIRWCETSTSSGVITKDTGTKQYETMHSRTGPIHDEMSDTQMQVKTKKFKFTIIGDGYIYYMLSDMQSGVKFNPDMCNHTLTIVDALKGVESQHKTLQSKKRKVMIAIGVTDLRNGRSFGEMKRDFTALFLRCDQYGLKPLITTIICYDSPQLKNRADLFNGFLLESFENVVDMRVVQQNGLADVMTALNKKHAMKLNRTSLGLGTRQQLVLNVPTE